MRKVTRTIAEAFKAGRTASCSNTHTDGQTVFLHGHPIVRRNEGRIEFSLAGWPTVTTRDRINGVLRTLDLPYEVFQRGRMPFYHNGEKALHCDKRASFPMATNGWISCR